METPRFLVLMVGNVGAGKTTLANRIAKSTWINISIDEWEGEYNDLNGIIFNGIKMGKSIILDGNIISKRDRRAKRAFVLDAKGKGYKVVILGPVPKNSY